jgi:hypothetical protein
MENGKQPAFGGETFMDLGHPMLDNVKVKLNGLTKREYFAGLAMQGLLTRFKQEGKVDTCLTIFENKRIASESVIMADNILEALDRPKSE